jgi:hypothetical protein
MEAFEFARKTFEQFVADNPESFEPKPPST